jgi:ribosomal protein L11
VKFEQAWKKLEANKQVQEKKKNGFYVSSLMVIPEDFENIREWTFVFFHPDKGNVFSVTVNAGGVTVGKESSPLVEDHYEPLDLKGVKPEKVIKKIEEKVQEMEGFKIPAKIIITYREGTWRAGILTQEMKLLRIDLNQDTGKVEKTEVTSMLK